MSAVTQTRPPQPLALSLPSLSWLCFRFATLSNSRLDDFRCPAGAEGCAEESSLSRRRGAPHRRVAAWANHISSPISSFTSSILQQLVLLHGAWRKLGSLASSLLGRGGLQAHGSGTGAGGGARGRRRPGGRASPKLRPATASGSADCAKAERKNVVRRRTEASCALAACCWVILPSFSGILTSETGLPSRSSSSSS